MQKKVKQPILKFFFKNNSNYHNNNNNYYYYKEKKLRKEKHIKMKILHSERHQANSEAGPRI